MELLENRQYQDMLRGLDRFPRWSRLEGKTLYLSGGSGMLGSLLIDAVMTRNQTLPPERRCRILAAGRNRPAA